MIRASHAAEVQADDVTRAENARFGARADAEADGATVASRREPREIPASEEGPINDGRVCTGFYAPASEAKEPMADRQRIMLSQAQTDALKKSCLNMFKPPKDSYAAFERVMRESSGSTEWFADLEEPAK